jgi:hypothetical protein
MSKYYQVQISGTGPGGAVSIYLTSTGANGGRPCKTSVVGLAGLLTPDSGNTTVASNGSPFNERPLTAGKGRPFEILSRFVPINAVYDDLKELIDYVVEQGTVVTIEGTGEPGNFDVDAIPHFNPYPIEWDDFGADVLKGLKLRFIVSEVNS